jgi:RNA-directed DNA polymerase
VERYWHKMLCSRSRKGRITGEVFKRIKARFPLLRPRLLLPYAKLQPLAVL